MRKPLVVLRCEGLVGRLRAAWIEEWGKRRVFCLLGVCTGLCYLSAKPE